MSFELIAAFFTALGDILIGVSVIRVHSKLSKEKRIDKEVVDEVKEEKWYVFFGILFIIIGFVFNLLYHY